MSDVPEATIVNTFTQAFQALVMGRKTGTLTPIQEAQLIDVLGVCFRDYVIMHRSMIDAQRTIEKAKHATQEKPH